MRRLASVLVASRRNDKADSPTAAADPPRHRLVQKKSRVFPSLSRKHTVPPDSLSLPPFVASDLANSSSSSSSGSTTLRTPDDDGLPRTSSRKGSWKSWLGGKNAPVADHPEERTWQSSQTVLRPPKPGSNEADDASLHSDDLYGNPVNIPTASHAAQQADTARANARANARVMIVNSLVHEPTSPPLFQLSDAISFPRSCHNLRCLRRRETLESELHKKSLLRRLDRLSPSAEMTIASLASKQMSPKAHTHRNLQNDVFPSADAVTLHSNGLANWVSRPCFEDRLGLWTCSGSGEIIRTRVPGSQLGVAALEFSETIELLAGTLPENDEDVEPSEFTLPPLTLNLEPPAIHVTQLGSEPLSPSSKDSSVERSPAPHGGSTSLAPPKAPSPERQRDGSPPGPADSIPKRGVRFADDDGKDDQIPLGYVLRIRKSKEEKARFLRGERERRERAAQLSVEDRQTAAPPQENRVARVVAPRQRPARPLISLNGPPTKPPPKPQQPVTVSQVVSEEHRLRSEFEKIEMEKLRRSREASKKQAEEWERAYNEELQATRTRREGSRAGRPLESGSLSPWAADRGRSASRDSMYASAGRSGVPQKHTPELVFSPVSPNDGSPSSSMPATPGSQYSLSRPPSLYSTHTASSEDVRARDGKRVGRRMSAMSDSGKGMMLHPPYDPRASFNPYAWAGVPPVPPMPVTPMVNGVPVYGMDMPLLPPTPPFMMNQFGVRSHSFNGLGGQYSPHQTPATSPKNYSSDRVNSSSRNSSPHSSGSHQRRSSDEATKLTKTTRDPRSGSNDVRASRTSVFMQAPTPQANPQRSSWLAAPEHHSMKRSSMKPVSGVYSSGTPGPMRRRTAAA